MPGRALGLAWFGIDRAAHKIDVALDAPEKVAPRRNIDSCRSRSPASRRAKRPMSRSPPSISASSISPITIARPAAYFYGQRQLSTEIRDLYGLLIDGMQGTRGAIRSGGDGRRDARAIKPTQEPLARYSGRREGRADGKAQVTFDMPAFNGTVRLMAVAWSKDKVGSASADVIVRDPVVVQATLPRFLALGDRSQLQLQIDNVEGPAGDYRDRRSHRKGR